MAIFKKLLVNSNGDSSTTTSFSSTAPDSQSGKVSAGTPATPSFQTGTYSFNSQKQRDSKDATSTNPNDQQATTSSRFLNSETQGTQDDLEDLCWSLYDRTLRKDEIRLTVFSEKDTRLLYDSETVVAVSDKLVAGSHRSECSRFQFLPHKYDTLRIAKMLFGTLPSLMKGDSLKIHTLMDMDCVMISRVFSVPRLNKYSSPFKSSDLYKCIVGSLSSDSDNQSNSNYSTIRSMEGIRDHVNEEQQHSSCLSARFPLTSSKTFTNSSDPPERFNRVRNSSLQLESSDIDDIMEELRAFSPNRLSRTRRRQLSQIGLDDGVSLRLSNRSRLSSCSSLADGCGLSDSSTEWKQYGFALLIPGAFRSFIFQHILQVERELDRLIIQIHKAVQDKSQFFQLIYEGWSSICDSLCLLCNSYRLKNPVWLGLISLDREKKGRVASDFCYNLATFIHLLNTKETKFFFSTAISAVLMNQLTWVASVAPREKCPTNSRSLLLGMTIIDPKQMPYNPTIAQLLELYSGIGTVNNGESRFAKVVVVGENRRLMAELLEVLSYFIRCSSVESQRKDKHLTNDNGEHPNPIHDFGRSLLAGVCNGYSPHFVLSAIDLEKCPFDEILASIYEDVRHPMGEPCANSQMLLALSPSNSQQLGSSAGFSDTGPRSQCSPSSTSRFSTSAPRSHRSTRSSTSQQQTTDPLNVKLSPEKKQQQQREAQEERRNTLVVLIDTLNYAVKVVAAENCVVEEIPFVCPSEAITSMFEEFAELYNHQCASDFLLSFLEDRLGSLLAKSSVLANLITTSDDYEPIPMDRMSSILGCDCSDLRLILNVAAVYSPGILATAL